MYNIDNVNASGSNQFELYIEVTKKDKVPSFTLYIPSFSTNELKNLAAEIGTTTTGTVLIKVGLPNSQGIVNEIAFPKSILDKMMKLGQEIKNVLEIKGNLDSYGLHAEFTVIPVIFETHNKLYFYGCSSGKCIRVIMENVFADKLYRPKEILNKILSNGVYISYEIPVMRDPNEIVTDLYYNLSLVEKALLIYSKGFSRIYTQIYDIVADATKYILASIKD